MPAVDIVCIGNAIVDIIAQCDDRFLEDHHIIKGAMNLIDAERAQFLYQRMGSSVETSGGSACNTAAGIAGLGVSTAFFGKVCDDELGGIFTRDIRATGTLFRTRPLVGDPPTARSMIFVTPDAERSMNTYLGACVEISADDIDGERLCWMSSLNWIWFWCSPCCFVADHGVECDDKFTHDGNKCDLLWLSRANELCIESLEVGIIPTNHANGDHVKDFSDMGTPSKNTPLTNMAT